METWSRGIAGFRGYREYRIFSGEECVVSCSSLWIYIDLETKTPTRLPEEIVATFPILESAPFSPELDRFGRNAPESSRAKTVAVSLRYSDIDANRHVNNASYLEFLQTALAAEGVEAAPRPTEVHVKFMREILPDAGGVRVLLESVGEKTLFSIAAGETICAQGQYR